MRWPLIAWWTKRRRRNDPFTRATHGDLDIVMPPPYDMSEAKQIEARTHVEGLLRQLQPGGLDAGSREVLNNLINAWADQAVARLAAERDERQAVGEVLIGIAREELARRKPRYDTDLVRALHTREALDVTFFTLTGKKTADLHESWPQRLDDAPVQSALGPVDLSESWVAPDETDPLVAGLSIGNVPAHTANGERSAP